MCHLVTRTVYPVHLVHTFIGEDHERISSINQKLFQTGIIKLYYNNEMYIYQYRDRMSVEKMDHLEARKDVPFTMTDWKILSIFIGWISLMGISAILLGFEKVIKIIFDYTNKLNSSFWMRFQSYIGSSSSILKGAKKLGNINVTSKQILSASK